LFGLTLVLIVPAISASAITDANSAIEQLLVPSLIETFVSFPTTFHSIAFANASFAVSMVAVNA
jgi:hypothetical protein